MDLVAIDPILNLYDPQWPIRTHFSQQPPAKFVFADQGAGSRRGVALDSLVSQGCILSGGMINRSIVSPLTRINSYAQVDESILFDEVEVGRHCTIRRTIVDKSTIIPPNTVIGLNHEEDRKRFHISPGGIVVVTKEDF